MKKNRSPIPVLAIVLLAACAPLWCVAQTSPSPCPTDTIGGGGSGVADYSAAVLELDEQPRCTQCYADACHSWQLPEDFTGHLYLTSPSMHTTSIQLTKECRWLLWDTCAALPSGPSQGQFRLALATQGSTQLVACAHVGDTVVLECKSTAIHGNDMLLVPVLDLQGCSTMTGLVQDPHAEAAAVQYFDPYTLEHVQPNTHPTDFTGSGTGTLHLRPNHKYLVRQVR